MTNPNKLADSRMEESNKHSNNKIGAFAQSQISKSSKYVNLGNLSLFADIEPQPGMEFFSIAIRKNGEFDLNEYTRVLRLGLRPVSSKHYPNCKLPTDVYYPAGMSVDNDVIEIGGHLLMECPIEDANAIREQYKNITKESEAAVQKAIVDDNTASQYGIAGTRFR